jgi:outer membrane protein assembly factor BamB/tRNA A-37 threonylcarbamoyl transferase component Bud32
LFAIHRVGDYNIVHIRCFTKDKSKNQYISGGEIELETQRISTESLKTNALSSDQQLQPGLNLANRYLIQGVVGVGGMGAVYRARDMHFPNVTKRVAVKEMINQVRDPSMRETLIKNFEREANLLATLEHPAIPKIYDYFSQNDRSYLILEFIDGKDMEALLVESQGYFPESQIIGWAIELCDVLSFLHNHQPEAIIFRDMKPSNVMIDQRGHIILVDFGIAKTFQTGQKGTMIGTEGYSPPEQYKGEAGPLSDIYALGATLHHLLTRRDPRLEAPFSFTERPIRAINPSVSIELETVVSTALQYNPADRYPTAAAMKEALIATARKTGVLSNLRALNSDFTEGLDTTKVAWTFETEDEIRGTPAVHDGVVYVGSYDNNLYAINITDGSFIWKYAADAGIVTQPIIADGNVFFGSEDKRLHVISARSGKIIWSYYTDGPVRSSPSIGLGHIVFGADDGFLHVVNSITGRRAWRFDAGAPIRSTPLIQSDQIYFGTEEGDFYCLDLNGAVKWRFKSKRAITSSAAVFRETIIVGSVDGIVYALDLQSGFVIWRFRLGKATISTPCVAENMVFIGSTDNHLYCLDASNAKEIWKFATEHQVNSSPFIYRDSIYFSSVDKHLYCLEYRSGRMRWKYPTGGMITGSPVVYDNLVFIGSTDHKLYAFNI